MIPKNASLTYDQVRTEMIDSGEACNLLIGNGFSIAFDKMFAVIFLISAISLILMWLVDLIQKWCMPWEKTEE